MQSPCNTRSANALKHLAIREASRTERRAYCDRLGTRERISARRVQGTCQHYKEKCTGMPARLLGARGKVQWSSILTGDPDGEPDGEKTP